VAAGGDAAARRAPERQRERGWRRGRGRMALFRKFFLKKTPDRLLEISERVYGIMLSPLGRAGSCGRVGFAGVLHFLQEEFLAPAWFRGFEFW